MNIKSVWKRVGISPLELTRPLPKGIYRRGNASTYYAIVRGRYVGSYPTVDEAKTARDRFISNQGI